MQETSKFMKPTTIWINLEKKGLSWFHCVTVSSSAKKKKKKKKEDINTNLAELEGLDKKVYEVPG